MSVETVACVGCGTSAAPDARFCSSCGRALGRGDDAGERRWVTVLFADLSGFTAFAHQRDPEDVRLLVDRALGRLGAIVEEHGGTVARVIGDEVLALFGAPVAHGDDPDRAVRAALEMQSLARRDRAALAGLALRVGINTGEVLYAPLGTGTARVPTVTGDPANVAKRLEQAASPGQVLLGEPTVRASRRTIRTRPVAPVPVGDRPAVPAYEALEVAPAGDGTGSPFVGRATEAQMLDSVWARVVEHRQPHLVTVVGPSGIGKTRLSTETVARLDDAARVLPVRCLPYGGHTGYGPLAAALVADLGLEPTASREAVRERLEHRAAELQVEDAEQTTAVLSTLLGGSGPAPRADRDLLLLAMRRWFTALARTGPTVLVVEDVHWADTSLLELLPALVGRLSDVPLLALVLARPALFDRAPGWGAGLESATTLTLGPLPDEAAADLAGLLLGDADDPARRAAVCELAAGNPLFLEEIGAAVEEGTTLHELPTTVTGILAARLDALSPRARGVLLDASVLGKLIDVDSLAVLSGRDGLDAALEELEHRDMLRRSPSEGWLFKHMTVREVAYGTLPRSVRRERHRAVALAVEGGEVDGRRAALVAHHWIESGAPDRALPWLLLAADLATRTWAKAEAVALYDAALDLLDPDAPESTDVRLRRATALYEHGSHAEAVAELDDLLPQLQGVARADALLVMGFLRFNLMDAEGVLAVAGEVVELAEELDDDERRGPAYGLRGLATTLSGDNRSGISLIQRGLELWVPGTRDVERVQFEEQIALSRQWACDYEEALAVGRQAAEAGRALCLTSVTVRASSQQAMTLAATGRPVEALRVVDRAIAVGEQLEAVPQWQARCWNVRAGALRELHDLRAARLANERAIACGVAASFLMPQLQGQVDLMLTDLLEGAHEPALERWPGLWEHVDDAKGWHGWLMRGRLLQIRADLLLSVEGPAAALPAAHEALAHAVQHDRKAHEVLGRLTGSRALLALGRVQESLDEATAAQRMAEQLRHPVSRWQAWAQRSRALASAGDAAGSQQAAQRARDAVEGYASSLPAPYAHAVRSQPQGLGQL